MGQEIEHKYTIHLDKLPILPNGTQITQGYLPTESLTKTRIRLTSFEDNKRAFLTVKGAKIMSACQEFEYEIPFEDGKELIQLCDECIIKTRYVIPYEGNNWEIDFFEGNNEGLVMAEIEFQSIGETYLIPDWANEDVSADRRYFNSNLIDNPYKDW